MSTSQAGLVGARLARLASTVLLAVVVTACTNEYITWDSRFTCQSTRPALQGTWVGMMDSAEIVLRMEESCRLGAFSFAEDSWSINGSWAWKDWNDQLDGSVLTGAFANEFGAKGNYSYLLTLYRYAEGGVHLRIDSLPAGSTITAHVSGSWRRPFPLEPPPGPIVLRRR